ncbi:MAG: response regulator [Nitrospirae bacterium]|nr:response regulator [Nitrospirota bacterium]
MSKVILAVDDSKSIREMVASILQSAGFEVIEAVDGKDGLEKARQKKVDLILTDQNMPNMDGLALIKALRSLTEYKLVPISMLTTESGDIMKHLGKTMGATGWLVKPFDPEKWLEIVNKVIG